MSVGRRAGERQQEFWVATQDMSAVPRHAFYDELNRLLAGNRSRLVNNYSYAASSVDALRSFTAAHSPTNRLPIDNTRK